jgi:hypothetical protein
LCISASQETACLVVIRRRDRDEDDRQAGRLACFPQHIDKHFFPFCVRNFDCNLAVFWLQFWPIRGGLVAVSVERQRRHTALRRL